MIWEDFVLGGLIGFILGIIALFVFLSFIAYSRYGKVIKNE